MSSERMQVVMVVDASEHTRGATRLLVQRVGVSVVEASEPAQALARLAQVGVDLVVVSMGSSCGDGPALVRAIRRGETCSDVAILAVVDDDGAARDALAAGCDELVLRSAQDAELVLRVQCMLRLRGATRRVAELEAQLAAVLTDSASKLEDSRQQMIQAQKMESVGRLAGGVAHDFNNILTSIICFTRFVVDDLSPSDPRRADLVEVLKSADSATRLTSQLLTFSRRSPVQPVVLDVNAALGNVDRVLRRTLGGQVELVILPTDETMRTLIDAGQLDQLVFNLALNARDAMPTGGTVTFRVGKRDVLPSASISPGPYIELTCSDTGGGMTAEVQSRVFEPFFTTKGDKGTGLGLATCYGIVERARGRISLATRVGEGTTFTVLLPRVFDDVRADPRRSANVDDLGLRGTVLVVEDQAAILRTMMRAFEMAGFTVLGAPSAEDALALLKTRGEKVDLLATDVMLPGMSGIKLAERLRAEQRDLPVLFVSGYASDSPEPEVQGDARTVFLPKPFSGRQLVMRAATLLAPRGQ